MNKLFVTFTPWTVLVLSWALPIYSLIYNRLYPSYESALSVAYGFAIGSIIHVILMVLLLVVSSSKIQKSKWLILICSLILLLLLTVVSNSGALSKVSVTIGHHQKEIAQRYAKH